MMTEDEAKTKWCPHAVPAHWSFNEANIVRDASQTSSECLCLASRCMSWRWVHTLRNGMGKDETEKLVADDWKVTSWQVGVHGATFSLSKRTDHGYCGLSGKPE